MTYRTKFNLTAPVIDFEAAYDYLIEDNMTDYLHNAEISGHDKVIHIAWYLMTEEKGYIEVQTDGELTAEESRAISDWIRGQNSDGLGEGFEQQDFACYSLDDDEDGYDEYVMASFDWETNDYELTLSK